MPEIATLQLVDFKDAAFSDLAGSCGGSWDVHPRH